MPQSESVSVPVYLPMATVHSGIQSLRSHGLPPRIDRSAWHSRSGADQSGLLSALKFLGLIDEQGHTQPELRKLVETAAQSDEERQLWGDILRKRYAKVFEHDLTTATPNQIAEAISVYGNPSASTKKRAIRFFLKSAEYAGVQVSKRLLKDLRERGTDRPSPSQPAETAGANGGSTNGKPRRKRRTSVATRVDPPEQTVSGSAMKTIELVIAGGTLTLNGTFNPFSLVGEERELVYDIIDKMNAYEAKNKERA